MKNNRTEAGDHLPPGTGSGRQQRRPARSQKAVVLGTFPQVPTPSCAAGNREAKPAASAPTRRATAEVAAPAVGGCRQKRAWGDRAQRPKAVEWRDRRGSHLKQGGFSNTSTRQEQDGYLSRDRERRRRPRRRESVPRDTSGPASLSPEQPIPGAHIRTTKPRLLCASQ